MLRISPEPESLANRILLREVAVDECLVDHSHGRRRRRVAVIESAPLRDRGSDGPEVPWGDAIDSRVEVRVRRRLAALNGDRELRAAFVEWAVRRKACTP